MTASPPLKNNEAPDDLVPARRSATGMRSVLAHELFQGEREVQLEHAGEHYRLRITASGKLILTK